MIHSKISIVVFWVTVAVASCAFAEPVSFSRDIASILVDNCQACHGKKKSEGGYRVDSFELAVGDGDSGTGFVTGDLDASESFRRIVSNDEFERMPLNREPLPKTQVDLLKQWIAEGAQFDGPDPTESLTSLVTRAPQPDPPEKYRYAVPITALQFSQDGSQLFVGGYHEITVWDTESGNLIRRIANMGQRTMGMDLSGDGKTLVVAGGAPGKLGALRWIDLESGKLKKVLGIGGDLILDVQFSPDSDRIAAVTAENGLYIYDSSGNELKLSLTSHSDWVAALAWSPDGSKIVTASRDKTCKVIDAKAGDLLISYTGHGKPVKGVAFHAKGIEVYSAGTDNKVHRWQIKDGKKTAEFGFSDEVYGLKRSEKFLFAASADKTVRQFDWDSNKEVRQFKGHSNRALVVDHHPELKRLASGGLDGEIRIWNVDDGTVVTRFFAAPGFERY